MDKVALATPNGMKVEYLHVDSSKEHMEIDSPGWKLLGENLQLQRDSQCYLSGDSLPSRIRNPEAFGSMKDWIGNWKPYTQQGASTVMTAGGQMRRLGRALFACNAPSFMEMVRRKELLLRRGAGDGRVHFHIIAGLAGGTGSGSLIDAICLIRKEFPNDQKFPILLYLLLPDLRPIPGWAKANYHANGYAALWELNALNIGAYHPYDVSGGKGRHQNLESLFRICYLITNDNAHGAPFDVDQEVPKLMAETLHQTIISENTVPEVRRVVGWENLRTEAEDNQRARAFASFGIKKICYPEEEIREYVGYSLSSQTLLQMLYNHWAQGYLEESPGNLAVEGLVADGATQRLYNLDREVFFLERQFSTEAVEKDQVAWKTFDSDWRAFIERLSADIVREEGNWLETLMRRCEDRQKKSLREGRGVLDYFSWKKDRIPEYARLVVSGIEDILSGDLFEGKRSLSEIEAILRALCATLEKKQTEWQKQAEEDSGKAAKQRLLGVENRQRFEDLGPLARKMPGNKERIFEAGKDVMILYFALSTRVSAWEFAMEFVKAVRADLTRLADHVGKVVAGFRTAVDFCQEQVRERRPEERNQNLESNDVVTRLFNSDEVIRYVEALTGNKEFQDKQARQARDQMIELLMHGRTGLRNLPTADKKEKVLDILAKSSHETLLEFDAAADSENADSRAIGRLLSVSIVDKLRERYEGNPDLMRNEIAEHMRRSGYLIELDAAEHAREGLGTSDNSDNQQKTWIVMLPGASNKDDSFITTLKDAFERSVPEEIKFVDTGETRKYEITILSFVQKFPLRYVKLLSNLKEKYDVRLNAEAGAVHEVHSEDPSGQFPPLFVPPLREIAGPQLLLGLALGAVRPKSKLGVVGTIHDELVCVDDKNDILHDLGIGFEDSIFCFNTSEIFDALLEQSRKKLDLLKRDPQMTGETRARISAVSREISGSDDDARKVMRPLEEASLKAFDSHFQLSPGRP